MNICSNEAGYVTTDYILSCGFCIYDSFEGEEFSLPQFKNDKCKITGGYWTYYVRDLNDVAIWQGWWNSNEEFYNTMTNLGLIDSQDHSLPEHIRNKFESILFKYLTDPNNFKQ